jgi:cytochrome c-type biogenesis protein
MKLTKAVFLILLCTAILSCGKKDDTKPVTDNKQNTETSKKDVSGVKLFKIGSIEDSKGNKLVPDISWDENGKKVSLSDYKGKVVFINFWATWCIPCKKEMPYLSEIATELKDRNFVMLGMNVFHQPNSQKIEDFLAANPVSYTMIDGNEQLVEAFKKASGNDMSAVPTTFIIDKDGKIVETIVGSRDKATFLSSINKHL